ncbi:hypothetical protein BMW23_1096 [Bodo saltans virus]|uniref:Uncharacterized protein n=1 Tax=Bodo saltans virus TaxID=2024608 RepID=A0A2H4UW45_9VIRU|nr:hypothetical protein QJ851_gp1077 [Bodo saltans virus]ATZ81140.1 hypothetical protein BMW23_1096 [Bodo saltans virus]
MNKMGSFICCCNSEYDMIKSTTVKNEMVKNEMAKNEMVKNEMVKNEIVNNVMVKNVIEEMILREIEITRNLIMKNLIYNYVQKKISDIFEIMKKRNIMPTNRIYSRIISLCTMNRSLLYVVNHTYFKDFLPKSLEDICCEFGKNIPVTLPFAVDEYCKNKPENVIWNIFLFLIQYKKMGLTQFFSMHQQPQCNILLSKKMFSMLNFKPNNVYRIETHELQYMIFDIDMMIVNMSEIDKQFINCCTIEEIDNCIYKNKYEVTSQIIMICFYYKQMNRDLLCYLLSLKTQYTENEMNQIIAFTRLYKYFADIIYTIEHYNYCFTKSNYEYIISSPYCIDVIQKLHFNDIFISENMMDLLIAKPVNHKFLFEYYYNNIDKSNDKYVVFMCLIHDLREIKIIIDDKKLIITKKDIDLIMKYGNLSLASPKIKYLLAMIE